MSDFFKESDCDCHSLNRGRTISLTRANELVRERGKVVFSAGSDSWHQVKARHGVIKYSHQALLISVEPIEKPDSAEEILKDLICKYENHNGTILADTRKAYERAKALLEKGE